MKGPKRASERKSERTVLGNILKGKEKKRKEKKRKKQASKLRDTFYPIMVFANGSFKPSDPDKQVYILYCLCGQKITDQGFKTYVKEENDDKSPEYFFTADFTCPG